MKKKIIIIAAFVTLAIFLIGITYGNRYINAFLATREAMKLEVEGLNLGSLQDGTYEGYYSLKMASTKVKVVVTDNQLIDIVLIEHSHSNGHSGGEIIKDILSKQSLDVDVISGSTISSMTILKAVEDALSKEPVSK